MFYMHDRANELMSKKSSATLHSAVEMEHSSSFEYKGPRIVFDVGALEILILISRLQNQGF